MKKAKLNYWLQSPRLEIIIMLAAVILSYFGLAVLSLVPQSAGEVTMTTANVAWIQFAFFMLSVAIAMISVIAGIGGGVIFTPIMLAFTTINSVIVRGTGLIVAMFSGLISTGIFIKKGLSSYKLALVMTLSQAAGALSGALLAISAAEKTGVQGEGLLRTALGVILALIAVYFIVGGKKLANPVVTHTDRFTSWLGLNGSYLEQSEGRILKYRVKRAPLGILLIFIVGVIGGFFGMGGGWAITPVLNLGMGIPLKLAAANSGVILGIGSCVSIWPYIYAGGIIPMFILPWLAGQVIGGFIGSYALAKIRVSAVRLILIGIMAFTSFGLISKGLDILGAIESPAAFVQIIIFSAIILLVILAIIRDKRHEKCSAKTEENTTGEPDVPLETLPPLPLSNRVYGTVIHWITIVCSILALFIPLAILIDPSNNILNPNLIFRAILDGATPADIWAMSATGGFPGGHYYLCFLTQADSWAQFAINLGCSVGIWGLIPTVAIQLIKEKNWFYAFIGILLAFLILLAMLGVF